MMLKKSRIIITVVLISIIAVSNSAFAGFKLKRTYENTGSEYVGSRKVDEVDREIITSVISSDSVPLKEEKKQEAVELTKDETKKDNDEVITGFGQDLPLLVSLQQIIPAKYKFTVEQGIDAKVLTSWEGGSEWKVVLEKMLAPKGLSFVEEGGAVVIKSKLAKQAAEKITESSAPVIKNKPLVSEAVASKVQQTQVVENKIDPKKEEIKKEETVEEKEVVSTAAAEEIKQAIDKEVKETSTKRLNKQANKTKAKSSKSTKVKSSSSKLSSKNKNEGVAPVNIVVKSKVSATEDAKIVEELSRPVKARMEEPAFEYSPDAKINPDWRMSKAKWVGHRGQTLKEVLSEWSEKEGVELYWAMDYDYKLGRDIAYNGEYETAIARVINIFKSLRPQPYGQLHKGTRGPLVLVVNSYDLSH